MKIIFRMWNPFPGRPEWPVPRNSRWAFLQPWTAGWLVSWAIALLSIGILISAIFGQHGYIALRKQQESLRQAEQERDRIKAEQLRLKKQVEELNQQEGIEKVAREEMKLAKPDEIVVTLPESSPSSANESNKPSDPNTPAKNSNQPK